MAYAERFSQDAPTDRLLAFIEFLRGRDILISPADSLVAMEVAGLVGYDDRTLLKNGLGSALAKSKFEIEVFNEAFEQYFGTPSSTNQKMKTHPAAQMTAPATAHPLRNWASNSRRQCRPSPNWQRIYPAN